MDNEARVSLKETAAQNGVSEAFLAEQALLRTAVEAQVQAYIANNVIPSSMAVTFNGKFIVRIFKRFLGATKEWVNTYEIAGAVERTLQDAVATATQIILFEAGIHIKNLVELVRVTISTWSEDGKPYDPQSFLSIPLDVKGQRNIGENDPEPAGLTYRISKSSGTGRLGAQSYRGVLHEGDKTSIAGRPAFDNTDLVDLAAALFDVHLKPLMFNGNALLKLALISKAGLVRLLVDIVSYGISFNKDDHKYYDVKPGTK